MNDIQKIIKQKLQAQENRLEKTSFMEDLAIAEHGEAIVNGLREKVAAILPALNGKEGERRECWTEFGYKSGSILGLLRQIAYAKQHQPACLKATGIPKTVIDAYVRYAGNLPYRDKEGNIKSGRPMDCQNLKNTLIYFGNKMGVIITDDLLSDLTDEHFKEQCQMALERLENDVNTPEQDVSNVY